MYEIVAGIERTLARASSNAPAFLNGLIMIETLPIVDLIADWKRLCGFPPDINMSLLAEESRKMDGTASGGKCWSDEDDSSHALGSDV